MKNVCPAMVAGIGEFTMTKVVYNACYGGFGLSKEATLLYAERKGVKLHTWKEFSLDHFATVPKKEFDKMDRTEQNKHYWHPEYDRADPVLIQVIEELGSEKASGRCANLVIEDIPSGTAYRITEYDGYESLETREDIEWRIA